MGLFSFIKNQFIEVIEWTDSTTNTLVYRFPVANQEIKMGAKLTVRESQVAVFVSEGQIADVYTPGMYELYTQNMPVMTKLKSWPYGFNSPFKAEVYFVNTKQFTDQKWGTSNPIMMRDSEFGMLRLRAYGIFSYRVSDGAKFLKEIFGTNGIYDTESILGQLKRSLLSGFTDILGETQIAAIDLAAYYDELSEQTLSRLQPRFEALGLQLVSFYIENISLPEEVEKVLDKRTSMGVLGNMQQYTQYQAAEAIRDAAKNPGNAMASGGVGLGAGFTIGNVMSEALKTSMSQPQPAQPQPQPQKLIQCSYCNAQIAPNSKFCPECGKPQNIELKCKNCGMKLPAGVKFCPECGTKAE